MLAIKFVIILFVAISTNSAVPPENQQLNQELKGLVEDLFALLEQLTHIVGDAIAIAVKTVLGLVDIVVSAAADILGDLTKALDSVVSDLLGLINDLIQEAAEAGVDVTECIGSSVDDIKALPANFLLNTSICLSHKVDEAKEEIRKVIVDIESTADIITDLAEGITLCLKESILVQPICIATIASKIALDIVSLPIKISGDVASITAYVLGLVPGLSKCEVGVVAELTVAGTKIVGDVTACVNGKMQ